MDLVDCRTAVMEEVNDNELPMEPLHYPAVAIGTAELPPMVTASADRQMCVAEGGLVAADGDGEPQASEQAGLAGNLLANGVCPL